LTRGGGRQVLLTNEDLATRDRALCLRTTLLRLMELGVIPILNENDSVSVRELLEVDSNGCDATPTVFGDNDGLSARVATAIDADLLVLLTDVSHSSNCHTRTLTVIGWGEAGARVRVEIRGPGKYENVGKSQPVLMMVDPMISTRAGWRLTPWRGLQVDGVYNRNPGVDPSASRVSTTQLPY
jgi:hypothetical protein